MAKRPSCIPLTSETLKAAYEYLCTTEPFSRWNLPESDSITFKVAKDPHNFGWHVCWGRKNKKHIIAVSRRTTGHTLTLMTVMAHEILHVHQHMTGQATSRVEHNKAFRADAELICAIHGFDPRSF